MKLVYEVKCTHCGKVFYAGSSTGKWCSSECYYAHRKQERDNSLLHVKKCAQCGKEFTTTRQNKLFCSNTCAKKASRPTVQQHVCLLCGVVVPNNKKYCESCKPIQIEKLKQKQRKIPHDIECIQCGKHFVGVASNRKFCCKECLVKWHNKQLIKENSAKAAQMRSYTQCVVCGKTFFPPNNRSKCCSEQCVEKYKQSEFYKKRAYNYNKIYRKEKHEKVLYYSREHEARIRQARAIDFQKNLKKFDVYPEMGCFDAVGRPTTKYAFIDTLGIIRITENKCKCTKCGNTFLLGSGKKGQALTLLQRRLKLNKSPCPYCGQAPVGIKRNSTYEAEIKKLYPKFDTNVKPLWFTYNDKKQIQLELDLYDEQAELAIEFNGIVWHSTRFEKNINALVLKTDICEAHNVQLVHVWEYEWAHSKKLVLNKLNEALGQKRIYNQTTTLKDVVSKRELLRVYNFGNENNIEHSTRSSWACVLIDSKQNIIASAEFYNAQHEWILGRYTEKEGLAVLNGLKKSIRAFWKAHPKVNELYVYADRRWVFRKNNIYLKSGFREIKILKPNFMYTDLNIRHLPRKAINEPGEKGWYRLYDAGYIKYLIKKDE